MSYGPYCEQRYDAQSGPPQLGVVLVCIVLTLGLSSDLVHWWRKDIISWHFELLRNGYMQLCKFIRFERYHCSRRRSELCSLVNLVNCSKSSGNNSKSARGLSLGIFHFHILFQSNILQLSAVPSLLYYDMAFLILWMKLTSHLFNFSRLSFCRCPSLNVLENFKSIQFFVMFKE